MAYPAPDRSDHVANQPGQQFIDIGWHEGVMSDGRPYRAEGWSEEEMVKLTVYFSADGLEGLKGDELIDLIVREGIVEFGPEEPQVTGHRQPDASGNELWAIEVLVDDDGWAYVTGGAGLHLLPYPEDTTLQPIRMPAPSPERQRRLEALGIVPSKNAASAAVYPKPDRSNRVKRNSNDAFDVGWNEGALGDGRPFRSEYWVEKGVSKLTLYLPLAGIEGLSGEELMALLERDGVLEFASGATRDVTAEKVTDASGNEVWALQIILGDDDNNLAVQGGSATVIRPYL